MSKTRVITCETCGKMMEVSAMSARKQLYCEACSAERHRTYAREHARQKAQENPKQHRKRATRVISCWICGTEVETTCNTRKYCEICARKTQNKRKPEQKQVMRPAESLEEVNRKARETGLTYGKYMQRQQLAQLREKGAAHELNNTAQ